MVSDLTLYTNVTNDLILELNKGTTPEELLEEGEVRCKYNPTYPEGTIKIWPELVSYAVKYHENTKELKIDVASSSMTLGLRNRFSIPRDPESCWQLYYSSIKYSNKERIQYECLSILNQLAQETEVNDPVKGLVVGNVQSGKTMNMAGVISMAMDYKWNVIIILTGTIEALRKQTQRRLKRDLRASCNIHSPSYREIRWPEISNEGEYTESIKLDSDSKVYVTLCLKQADNLRKLLRYLNKNKQTKSLMKVLLIDDEADQASINTSPLDGEDDLKGRRAINRLIVNLVSGYDSENNPAGPYKAMNYIAYTATPYANLLSEKELRGETDEEVDEQLFSNLYPKHFIKLLTPAREYFGPTQIFGYGPQGLPGLNIINTWEDTNRAISYMMDHDSDTLPRGLKDAIAWFICCVIIKRKWVKEQPISMLINPDMLTNIHSKIEENIEKYLNEEKNEILSRCRIIYNEQTKKLSPEQFRKKMGSINTDGMAIDENGNLTNPYCDETTIINDYPPFEEIEPEIRSLLSVKPEPYYFDSNKEIHYHSGIHICIDNSRGNNVPRLIYPDKEDLKERNADYPDPSPAIIVIGGNTLSRGLTIEGLVSTYFARELKQADVSMQMCRWFGFRKGYELLPRMWMSERILKKYLKTVDIDESVRKFIRENYDRYTPLDMVVAIKNYPGLRSTSKQKSRGAIETVEYSEGYNKETNSFYRDESILRYNMELTKGFLNEFDYESCKFTYGEERSQWTTAPMERVMKFLRSFRSPVIKHKEEGDYPIDPDKIEKTLNNSKVKEWVIVVGNLHDSPRSWIELNGTKIGLIGRSKGTDSTDEIVTLSSRLINPRDQYADCDPEKFKNPCNDDRKDWEFKDFDNHVYEKYTIREGCGRLNYPVLIVYGISGPVLDKRSNGLDLKLDAIGLCVQLPGKKPELGSARILRLRND